MPSPNKHETSHGPNTCPHNVHKIKVTRLAAVCNENDTGASTTTFSPSPFSFPQPVHPCSSVAKDACIWPCPVTLWVGRVESCKEDRVFLLGPGLGKRDERKTRGAGATWRLHDVTKDREAFGASLVLFTDNLTYSALHISRTPAFSLTASLGLLLTASTGLYAPSSPPPSFHNQAFTSTTLSKEVESRQGMYKEYTIEKTGQQVGQGGTEGAKEGWAWRGTRYQADVLSKSCL